MTTTHSTDGATSAEVATGPAEVQGPLSESELRLIDAYWRAANYLSVGQIYLLANPLLREPLVPEHVKPRLLGHWGTTPGLNFIYAHMNRVIRSWDLDAIYRHGSRAWRPRDGRERVPRGHVQRGLPEHHRRRRRHAQAVPPVLLPGRHPEPRRAGDARARSTRAASSGTRSRTRTGPSFDNPDLLVCCVVGDGEAETGPLATSWHSNKFLDPVHDGAVLPILHLNGYKIANPTVLARIPHDELVALFEGYGYHPYFVEGDDPALMHQAMALTMDQVIEEIATIQRDAREGRATGRPTWPMIVLRSPKGWTGPKVVDGLQTEGTFRSHQVPMGEVRTNPDHLALLEEWLRSYRPEELFDDSGALIPELAALPPKSYRRMSANPHANGGLSAARTSVLPDFREYAVDVPRPGGTIAEATRVLGSASCGTSSSATARHVPAVRARRDGVEPAGRRLRGH